jgi:hypothetical protein
MCANPNLTFCSIFLIDVCSNFLNEHFHQNENLTEKMEQTFVMDRKASHFSRFTLTFNCQQGKMFLKLLH